VLGLAAAGAWARRGDAPLHLVARLEDGDREAHEALQRRSSVLGQQTEPLAKHLVALVVVDLREVQLRRGARPAVSGQAECMERWRAAATCTLPIALLENTLRSSVNSACGFHRRE
jgi:hypothetical protein